MFCHSVYLCCNVLNNVLADALFPCVYVYAFILGVCVHQVTINDVISAERLFGTLGHIAATETPRCRLLVLLEESR